jgi:ABC-type glycerol-3-phosphate transport system permease component
VNHADKFNRIVKLAVHDDERKRHKHQLAGIVDAAWSAAARKGVPVGTVLRHVILVFFTLIILVPLAWVPLLSIKSIPDA